MSVYTTFFLCRPEELADGFPGWRPPLPRPVRRQVVDPFTGEISVIETTEPEWTEEHEEMELPDEEGPIPRNYEEYLEARLPPLVRARPHWAAKGVLSSDLEPLIRALGIEPVVEQPLYGPAWSTTLEVFPPGLLRALGRLSEREQVELAKTWAAAMSTLEETHSVSGAPIRDGWTAPLAFEILRSLVDLARKRTTGQRLYLLGEE